MVDCGVYGRGARSLEAPGSVGAAESVMLRRNDREAGMMERCGRECGSGA
jgi:hypothetical protein